MTYKRCKVCNTTTGGRAHCHTCLEANPRLNNKGRRGATWNKVRAVVLERDGWTCQVRIPGVCRDYATQVDHVVELWRLGPDDPRREDAANLRASCGPCNAHRSNPRRTASTPPPADQRRPTVNPSRQW